MTLGTLLLVRFALAHGGEDHGAAVVDALVDGPPAGRVVLHGDAMEGVLSVTGSDPSARAVEVLLADTETNAPTSPTSGTLTLTGRSTVMLNLTSAPGTGLSGTGALSDGAWAGTLVTSGPDALFSVDALAVTASVAAADGAAGATDAGVGPLVLAGVVGAGLGALLARRRGAVMGLLGMATLATAERALAHGGEDHGPAVNAVMRTLGVDLPLRTQFLLGMRTARARTGTSAAWVFSSGVLVPGESGAAALRAPVDGVLRWAEGVRPGSVLRKGQRLFVVEEVLSASGRAEWAQSVARRTQAQGALRIAERDVAALETLGEAVSAREGAAREAALEAARAEALAVERGGWGAAPRTEVRAPFAGTLATREAGSGDLVAAGDALGRVVATGRAPWARVRVPEHAFVALGATAHLQLADTVVTAQVLDTGAEVDPRTASREVTLVLDQALPAARPGARVRAWLPLAGADVRPALLVPEGAVHDAATRPFVVVKTDVERFATREVRVGDVQPDGEGHLVRPVLEGLVPGERVVVTGAAVVRAAAGR